MPQIAGGPVVNEIFHRMVQQSDNIDHAIDRQLSQESQHIHKLLNGSGTDGETFLNIYH